MATASDKIDPEVKNAVQDGQTTDIIVTMAPGLDAVREEAGRREYSTRADRLNGVNNALREYSDNAQKELIQLLQEESKGRSFTWTSLYISNQVSVKGADQQLVEKIAGVGNVDKISPDRKIPLMNN